MKEIACEYAERNRVDDRFKKGKKTPGKDRVIVLCKRQNLSIILSGKCNLKKL
jgi:hypothetical protein